MPASDLLENVGRQVLNGYISNTSIDEHLVYGFGELMEETTIGNGYEELNQE